MGKVPPRNEDAIVMIQKNGPENSARDTAVTKATPKISG